MYLTATRVGGPWPSLGESLYRSTAQDAKTSTQELSEVGERQMQKCLVRATLCEVESSAGTRQVTARSVRCLSGTAVQGRLEGCCL